MHIVESIICSLLSATLSHTHAEISYYLFATSACLRLYYFLWPTIQIIHSVSTRTSQMRLKFPQRGCFYPKSATIYTPFYTCTWYKSKDCEFIAFRKWNSILSFNVFPGFSLQPMQFFQLVDLIRYCMVSRNDRKTYVTMSFNIFLAPSSM